MHFKVFSLKKCYKWICVFIICVSILAISYVIKGKQNCKLQTENLIEQVETIETKIVEEEVKQKEEEKIIFTVKEPTLEIPEEYSGWDVIRKTNSTKNKFSNIYNRDYDKR